MQSTMFLENLTQIDFAAFTHEGRVQGGSMQLSVEVTGTVDDSESVVVDFSAIKKDIKAAIDDKEVGFDHKCWIFRSDFEDGLVRVTNPETKKDFSDFFILGTDLYDDLLITTDSTIIEAPRNAFRFIDDIEYGYTEASITEYLRHCFSNHPANLRFVVDVSTDFNVPSSCQEEENVYSFIYTHGLKNSTSWGCQNPVHGHLSYLTTNDPSVDWTKYNLPGDDLLFIWRENIVIDMPYEITIRYETCRGTFIVHYSKAEYNIQILDAEPTVENIANWMLEYINTNNPTKTLDKIWVSEGLSNGVIATYNVT